MVTLVTGGSGSGKSEYGEALILGFNPSLVYYIATMEVWGKEGMEKVKRHRELRRGKGFITLECRRRLGRLQLAEASSSSRSGRAVFLECVSNLAANEMFGGEDWRGEGGIQGLAVRIGEDIAALSLQAEELVIITNEVGSDGSAYGEETMEYIRLMGLLNQRLAEMADQVVEVICGIPVIWKGHADFGLPAWKEWQRK